jgi:hypothetical protein
MAPPAEKPRPDRAKHTHSAGARARLRRSTPDPTERICAESTGRVGCRVLLDQSGEVIEASGMLYPPVDSCTGPVHNTDAQNLGASPASHPSSLGRAGLGYCEVVAHHRRGTETSGRCGPVDLARCPLAKVKR